MSDANSRLEAIIYVRVAVEEGVMIPERYRYDGYKITAPATVDYKEFLVQVETLTKSRQPFAIVVAPGWTIDKV